MPHQVVERYEFWKSVVKASGPAGLRGFPGFKDHPLVGQWRGFRASYLNKQYRVIYQRVKDEFLIEVVRVSLHDYKK